MTNKPMLSVERELLERAASAIEKHHGSLQWVIASDLRALLDKPVLESQYEGMTQDQAQAVSDGVDEILHGKPAAQHQTNLNALRELAMQTAAAVCAHEWTDDGQFAQLCPGCGMSEDYSKAFELAFIHGGTDEGNYFLEEDELLEVIKCHVDQLGIRVRESRTDKTKAELYDEVWQKARELGYNSVTDALSVTTKRR